MEIVDGNGRYDARWVVCGITRASIDNNRASIDTNRASIDIKRASIDINIEH